MIDLTPIANVLITLLATIVTVWVIPLIKSKTTASQQESLKSWVLVAVAAAEQLFGPGKGADKKAYVLDFLNKKGCTLSLDEIDSLIESSVYNIINNGSVKPPSPTAPEITSSTTSETESN